MWLCTYLGYLLLEAPREYVHCMVPFWASTDSVFVPNRGPRPKPHRPEEVVYIPNDSCSHITQRLSLQNFLSNIHVLLITIHSCHSYLVYITFIRATIAFIYMTYSRFHFPRLPWQAGCPRSFVSDKVAISLHPRILSCGTMRPVPLLIHILSWISVTIFLTPHILSCASGALSLSLATYLILNQCNYIQYPA
jgi:hypothetical protein